MYSFFSNFFSVLEKTLKEYINIIIFNIKSSLIDANYYFAILTSYNKNDKEKKSISFQQKKYHNFSHYPKSLNIKYSGLLYDRLGIKYNLLLCFIASFCSVALVLIVNYFSKDELVIENINKIISTYLKQHPSNENVKHIQTYILNNNPTEILYKLQKILIYLSFPILAFTYFISNLGNYLFTILIIYLISYFVKFIKLDLYQIFALCLFASGINIIFNFMINIFLFVGLNDMIFMTILKLANIWQFYLISCAVMKYSITTKLL